MITINQEKCIGCGACVKDCPGSLIYMSDGKARMDAEFCIRCGHCFALCPADAIRLQGYSEEDHQACAYLEDFNPVDPRDLLDAMKSRRSVRHFTESEKVRDYLKIQKQEHVVCVLALGYPALKYKRTVPRNNK